LSSLFESNDSQVVITLVGKFPKNRQLKKNRPSRPLNEHLCIFTDASDGGFGGYFDSTDFAGMWNDDQYNMHINWKELKTVSITLKKFGNLWPNRKILVHSDNTVVVCCINSGSSTSPSIQAILREIFWISANVNFEVKAIHIPGVDNSRADYNSRLFYLDYDQYQKICI